jgi:hypothetical protein
VRTEVFDAFKFVARRLGLLLQDAADEAFLKWARDNAPQANVNIVSYYPISVSLNVFDKAEIKLARDELVRVLGIMKSVQDKQAQADFVVELAKTIQKTRTTFQQTRDPDLEKLLCEAEAYLK